MTHLQIGMLIAAILLFIFIAIMLKKNSMVVKYSIMWLALPVIFILMVIFLNPLNDFAHWLGFEVLSNFVFFVILGCLLVLCFLLTIILSKQKRQIIRLIQEVSLLKKEQNDKKKK